MGLPTTEPVLRALQALEGSSLGDAVRNTPYLYPVLMALHVVGIALLLGPVWAFDLRLLGVGRRLIPVSIAAKWLLPFARVGFGIVALTGLCMFAGIPQTVWASAAAPWKFGLLAIAGFNLALFHLTTFRHVEQWNDASPPRFAKMAGFVSVLSWTSIVFAGRMLAY